MSVWRRQSSNASLLRRGLPAGSTRCSDTGGRYPRLVVVPRAGRYDPRRTRNAGLPRPGGGSMSLTTAPGAPAGTFPGRGRWCNSARLDHELQFASSPRVRWIWSSYHARRVRKGTSNPKPHENHNVASVPLIPKFASGVPQVLANFGIATLDTRAPNALA